MTELKGSDSLPDPNTPFGNGPLLPFSWRRALLAGVATTTLGFAGLEGIFWNLAAFYLDKPDPFKFIQSPAVLFSSASVALTVGILCGAAYGFTSPRIGGYRNS